MVWDECVCKQLNQNTTNYTIQKIQNAEKLTFITTFIICIDIFVCILLYTELELRHISYTLVKSHICQNLFWTKVLLNHFKQMAHICLIKFSTNYAF